jgi:hypothetical protein
MQILLARRTSAVMSATMLTELGFIVASRTAQNGFVPQHSVSCPVKFSAAAYPTLPIALGGAGFGPEGSNWHARRPLSFPQRAARNQAYRKAASHHAVAVRKFNEATVHLSSRENPACPSGLVGPIGRCTGSPALLHALWLNEGRRLSWPIDGIFYSRTT